MNTEILKNNVLKTLLYYDMFSFPLSGDELFTFLPQNSIAKNDFRRIVKEFTVDSQTQFAEKEGFYYVKPNDGHISKRKEKLEPTKKMWRMAGLVSRFIKMFPYVRCIMITGSLSKNNSDRRSDLDFMVITEKNRMWVARTLLMLFKKLFLFNSYKYFCINYYITSDFLEIEDKNIYTATEIAYVKATYNPELMNRFIESNTWIRKYFPNYVLCDPALHTAECKITTRTSIVQKVLEFFLNGSYGDKLDERFRKATVKHWNKRYANISEEDRNMMFRSTEKVSKAHPLNMQKQILTRYMDKLKEFNL